MRSERERLLTLHEAAARMGFRHWRTVRRMIERGELPPIVHPGASKYGRRFRVRESDVEACLRAREGMPDAGAREAARTPRASVENRALDPAKIRTTAALSISLY